MRIDEPKTPYVSPFTGDDTRSSPNHATPIPPPLLILSGARLMRITEPKTPYVPPLTGEDTLTSHLAPTPIPSPCASR